MLAKKYRLNREKDFERVYKTRATFHTALLKCKTAPNEVSHPRFGIVASKFLTKKAVERNRIKRRIRAGLLPFTQKMTKGVDIVFIAKKPVKDASFQEIEDTLQYLFKKIHLPLP